MVLRWADPCDAQLAASRMDTRHLGASVTDVQAALARLKPPMRGVAHDGFSRPQGKH